MLLDGKEQPMKKKTSIFYLVTIVVAIVCLILDLIYPNNSFSFLGICFALTMLVYGICLIMRGFQFKIDSSLFLGIVIFTFGIISTMTYFTEYGYIDLWHYILLGIGLASLITGMYFKSILQKKLAILFIGLFIIALLFQRALYKWWIMILLMLGLIVCFVIVNNILHNRRKG